MTKLPLYLSLTATISLLPFAACAEVQDARAMARGGVGLTMGEYNQALKNPALINHFDNDDDFSFAINSGVIASDEHGLLQGLDDVQKAVDALEQGQGSSSSINQQLKNLDNKMVQADLSTSVMIAIPNKKLPLALIIKGNVTFGSEFDYSASDTLVLKAIEKNALCPSGKVCSSDDLKSSVNASGLGVYDIGLMVGHQLANGLELGGTLKYQSIDLLSYTANASNFETGDVGDSKVVNSYSDVNIDLGGLIRLGAEKQFVIAATIENLIPQTYAGPVTVQGSAEYRSSPVVTTGVGYSNTYFKVEANTDLTPRHGFDQLLENQFARVGVELSAGRHFHLRAGYRSDMKNNVSDTFSAGIGITPWDRLNFDITGIVGDGDTGGAAIQVGFKI